MRLFRFGFGICCFAVFFAFRAGLAFEPYYRGVFDSFPETERHLSVELRAGDVAACRFETEKNLSRLTVACPSFSNNVGDLTLSLYRWKADYVSTLAEPPAASKTFVDFKDNDRLSMTFDPLDGEQWLWTLSEARERVGVWKLPESTDRMVSYFNGEPVEGTYQFVAESAAAFPYFGNFSTYQMLLSESTAPSEPTLVEDSAICALDVMPDTWDAIDELGRVLPNETQTGAPRADRRVGIFYWTWHNSLNTSGPFDNTKITAEHPEAVGDINHPAWGPLGVSHHWSEPLFGYYTTRDEWIHRRHAEMLADAGIDCVIFDATNGTLTWMESVEALMKVYGQARRDGVKTPKFAFMLPFWGLDNTATDLVQLWRDIYRDGRNRDLWFYWDGKPLIYAMPEAIDRLLEKSEGAEKEELLAIRKFFSFRPGQPAYTGGERRPDQWSWLEVYPQHGYGARSDGTFDMISVGVAQNHSSNKYDGNKGLAAMNDQNVFGRAHVEGQPLDTRPDADLYGGNFQQQWGRAFELDPRFVFVTGWNEWVAGRFPQWQGLTNAFPDQYNEPFSRDTEPSRSRLMDNYYMQLAGNVRRFKGARPQQAAGPKTTVDFSADSSDVWAGVTPIYRDYRGDTLHRDAQGYGETHYVNDSGRNDIVLSKVARDDTNLYFLVETAENLTKIEGANWLRLFLATPDAWRTDTTKAHWEHFDFCVEQTADGAVLKRFGSSDSADSTHGWLWETVCPVTRRVSGNRLELALPLEALAATADRIDLRFKWSDNMQTAGDILDFYQYGDTAPDGRFAYRYYVKPE